MLFGTTVEEIVKDIGKVIVALETHTANSMRKVEEQEKRVAEALKEKLKHEEEALKASRIAVKIRELLS